MADKKIAMLIQRLREKTDQGRIRWEKRAKDGDFIASFPNYAVLLSIRSSPQFQNSDAYFLEILNEDGEIVEKVSDEDFEGDEFEEEDAFEVMEELYNSARRNAMGIEKAVDSLLSALAD